MKFFCKLVFTVMLTAFLRKVRKNNNVLNIYNKHALGWKVNVILRLNRANNLQ